MQLYLYVVHERDIELRPGLNDGLSVTHSTAEAAYAASGAIHCVS